MKERYRVICQLRDNDGKLLREKHHFCINMREVFGLVDVCSRCGWTVRHIIELKED